MDRARYHALREKLKEYEGVDLTPYQERLESQKNLAEQAGNKKYDPPVEKNHQR